MTGATSDGAETQVEGDELTEMGGAQGAETGRRTPKREGRVRRGLGGDPDTALQSDRPEFELQPLHLLAVWPWVPASRDSRSRRGPLSLDMVTCQSPAFLRAPCSHPRSPDPQPRGLPGPEPQVPAPSPGLPVRRQLVQSPQSPG